MRVTICILLSVCIVLPIGAVEPVEKTAERKAEKVRPAGNLLTRYLDRAEIHPPAELGRLTIFPISLTRANRLGGVLTMAQALEKKLLLIEELPSASVPQAKFINKSGDKMIFLMAGEVITGGKQNRTLTTDALLGPDSATVLSVYCVQRGRWRGKKEFKTVTVAPQGVRERAAQKAGQGEVWAEVARANRRLESSDASGDLAVAMTRPANVERLGKLRKRIIPKLPPGCVGIVVAHDKRIIGADLFNSVELFAAMRQKVLDSYLSQYSPKELKGAGGEFARPGQDAVRKYLQGCYKARFTPADTRGVGKVFNITGPRFGQTLAYERQLRKVDPKKPSPEIMWTRQYMVHTALMQKIVPVKSKVRPQVRRSERRR